MTKCLVTQLNGACNDNSLYKVGEIRATYGKLNSPTKDTQFLTFSSIDDIDLEITEGGYFVSPDNLDTSSGTKKHGNESIGVWISNTGGVLHILNKYALKSINVRANATVSFDVKDFLYCDNLEDIKSNTNSESFGDIASLGNLPKINSISLYGNNLYGDIASLGNLQLSGLQLSSNNIKGDIASLNIKGLKTLQIANTEITGDISTLDMPNLEWFSVSKGIFGDISKFKCGDNTRVMSQDPSDMCDITGDLSECNVASVTGLYYNQAFTWGNGTKTKNFMILNYGTPFATDEDVDRMLIRQATLDFREGIVASNVPISIMCRKGTRTSASDSAVATLKQRGLSIAINNIPQ